ncbi:MAG: c-type cytochrome [Deltaproteobacteria bacterium]|nr:c-type cytochrome [Nannocystaceae bacterium]
MTTLVVVLLLAAVGATIAALAYGPLPHYEPEPVELVVTADPARIERGRRLVGSSCRRCHVDPITQQLGGRPMIELSPELGTAHSSNLTRSEAAGIGGWSDGELALTLRTGIHGRTGDYLPPWMPAFPRIADEDLASMLAFLRSDHPWTRPDDAVRPRSQPSLRTKLHAWLDWHPASWARLPVELPSSSDPVARGRYLVDELLQCNGCHGPTYDALAHARDDHALCYLGGGNPLLDVNGKSIPAANITFDAEHGIGSWSYADFRRALVDGFRPDGTLVRWPMRRHALLDENEVEAIYAYLATVPPVAHAVPDAADYRIVGPRVDPGRHVFYTYGCHYCHGESGSGIADLTQADAHFPSDAELVAFIRDPALQRPDTEMPSWRGVIAEDQLAEVAAYVRARAGE